MKVPWFGDRCIICLANDVLSEEHVVPAALGGDLKCDLLCKPCNDLFGSSFEARAKTDPAIRIAVAKLRSQIPLLYDQVEDGQPYLARSGPARVGAIFRPGGPRPRPSKHIDGSLMVPSNDAPEHIKRILKKDGHTPELVQDALMKLETASEGQKVKLSPDVSVINWPTDKAELDFSRGTPLHDLVAVKIAFEFLALISGTAICEDTPALNEIRRALKCARGSAAINVERLLAEEYAPFHGICFEGNDPHIKIQVRLFGRLAYRVQFLSLSLDQPKIAYTHNLKTGDQYVREYGPSAETILRGH
jgi:hypothetical protein